MPTFEEVAALVREQTNCIVPLTETTRLQNDLGVYGIDLELLLTAYAKRFSVVMSNYLWYFHTPEEGSESLGAMLFRPPNVRVDVIPITIGMLHTFAERGRWGVDYPPHDLPCFRFDVWVNLACGVACFGLCFLAIRLLIR